MSRPRGYTYGTHASVPPGYYYDDNEGYVGDYSESDGLSDPPHLVAAPTDVTEIYRRKPNMPPAPDHYHQNLYLPTEYYYDAVGSQPVARRTAVPVPYRKRIPVVNDRGRYYAGDAELYDHMGFRSTHQIAAPPMARNLPPRVPSATAIRQTVRRRPITVRTPRYYRRPGGTTLYKRPSALCLPVACQPDPAVYRRSKRMPAEQMYPGEVVYHQTPSRTLVKEALQPPPQLKVDKRKLQFSDMTELNITRSKLDAALERYEQIFEKNSSADSSGPLHGQKLVQMLKPRIPSSIKEKQQQKPKKHRHFDFSKADTPEVEEVASDALEEILLADLTANGLNDKKMRKNETTDYKDQSPGSPVSEKSQHETSPRKPDSKQEKPVKDIPKSFNYQDIQKGVVKSQQQQQHLQHQQQQQPQSNQQQGEMSENITQTEHQSRTTFNQTDESHVNRNTYSPCRSSSPHICSQRQNFSDNLDKRSESVKSGRPNVVPRVLVDDALELHRTKSYVVNLIDHALSNHFGTNLCEKYSTKDNPVDHRIAMEILKKHSSGKMDKDLCLEIAQALADTFHSSTNCSAKAETESKQDASSCSCSKIGDEPLYVKQLKQLRWGHLKHIQREVRRLEDLERFLDTCTSNSFV